MTAPTSVLVSAAEMRALEATAITAGFPEELLMDEAGAGLAAVVRQFRPQPGAAVIFCGKGHNAGDACVLAEHLAGAGWIVELRPAFPPEDWRPLARRKFDHVRNRVTLAPPDAEAVPPGRLLLIDGLLGTGAGGSLKSPVREACQAFNRLRERHFADSFAIDIPSGMDADSGSRDPDTIVADLTATIGYPKTGLVAAGADQWTGRLAVVPLSPLTIPDRTGEREALITPDVLRGLLPRRPFSMHKGHAGRIGIVAGSRGLTGAARLAATAAVAAGGGLVTLFCPADVYPILAAACPPEIMVRPVNSCLEVMAFPLNAVGIGPGMGPAPLPYLASLLSEDPRPVIIDADALNAMAAADLCLAGRAGGPRLLTPHPGELARLSGKPDTRDPDTKAAAAALAAAHDAVILSKSSRSAIIQRNRPAWHNTTGHPMMAKGGMGDVLTGFCTAFAARGLPLFESAALGSWLLGFSAELARRTDGDAPESFTPSRLIEHAGAAFASLRSRPCF